MSEHAEHAPMLPCPHCDGHGVMHWITYAVNGEPSPAYEACYHCEATGEVPAHVAIEHALRVEAAKVERPIVAFFDSLSKAQNDRS